MLPLSFRSFTVLVGKLRIVSNACQERTMPRKPVHMTVKLTYEDGGSEDDWGQSSSPWMSPSRSESAAIGIVADSRAVRRKTGRRQRQDRSS